MDELRMRLAYLISIIVFICLLSNANAQSPNSEKQGTLSLSDVIQNVLKNNDQAAAARYMEKAAQKKIGIAGAWDDPMLMLGVVNLPTSFDFKEDMMTMKMIGISQNIPYAGQKSSLGHAARADALRQRNAERSVNRGDSSLRTRRPCECPPAGSSLSR